MEEKKYATRSAVRCSKSVASADDVVVESSSRMRAPDTPAVGPSAPASVRSPPPSEMTELTPASVSTVRAPRSVTSHSSRVSRSEREARRLRAEYDAEVELMKLRESVVKKKLALEMAELAAEEEAEELDELPRSVASGPPDRVERWLQHSAAAAAPSARAAPLALAAVPSAPPAPSAPTDIERLADAIGKLARNKPLPRQLYEIPTFDGNPAEWLGFEKAYRSTTEIHQFRPYENMARLRVALIGSAKAAVDDLMRTSSDPEEVIEALTEEFGHPAQLLECALRRVRELPNVSDSGRELRSFTNVVRNCISILKTVRADGYLNSPQLVREVIGKLTTHQRAQYGEYAMRKEQENIGVDLRVSPNMKIVLEFLTQITRVASYTLDVSQPLITASAAGAAGTGRRDKGAAPVRTNATHRVHTQVETIAAAVAEGTDGIECSMCAGGHVLSGCEQFKQLVVDERWIFVKQNRLCFKCIVKRHSSRFCRAKRCGKCQGFHHELLHSEATNDSPPSLAPPPIVPQPPPAPGLTALTTPTTLSSSAPLPLTDFETVTNVGELRARALLKVIPVTIVMKCGDERQSYALLDDGASVSLLDESIAYDIPGPVMPLRLLTARGQSARDDKSRIVRLVVRGPNGVCHEISARTMRNVNLPSQTVPARVLDDNAHLRTLDCSELRDAKPMLLLGQDNWKLIVGREIRQGKSGRPVASLTSLGWVVHGPLGANSYDNESVNCMSILRPDLHDLVKAQFELEAIGISQTARKNDKSERALRILDSTSRRVPGGWEVGLLWTNDDVEMPDDFRYACRRLASIERKMNRDPEFANTYKKQVDRLISENYARKVVGGIKTHPVWYLPHFGVTNPNKPGKLRLVFDAAATFDGTSLNDNLLSGPDLLNSLMGVLIKFRIGKIAFTADIADMFLRVKIREADQGAQLFLWRDPRDPSNDLHKERVSDPDIYAMNVMIFGATSSPTSAIYILNKNAEEFTSTHPAAVDAIKRKHYVDDYLDSVDNVEVAQQLIGDVTHIHRAGGFDIRGWVTSSSELREKLPSVVPPGRVKLDRSESERTLGMIWCTESDSMKFDLSFKRLPTKLKEGLVTPTKREFLRFIMSIFDPLGLVYPCVIQSRVLMQRVWQSGISWDDCIKDTEASTWFQWLEKIKALTNVEVPRWYGLQLTNVDLHVFGDASELAYAAVAYLVGRDESGKRICKMVLGKARVAPVKVVSIPRLELQAAVLACRLAVTVKSEIDIVFSNVFLWTDSKTVLTWINSEARDYQKYVSYRLAEIDNLSKRSDWHWVPSESNPADEATRMDWPNNRNMWLSGPPFLCDHQVPWPTCAAGGESPADDPERIERALLTTEAVPPLIDVTRYSTWTRAVRVTAYVLAFTRTCRARRNRNPSSPLGVALTPEELREAETFLVREAQARAFCDELSALRAQRPLPKASRLLPLDPMLYEDGLLRVRGRLSASTELSFEEKHPIILDGKCTTARLLVHSYHLRALHANHETVVNSVRERYWVTSIRPTVKAVIARCQYCRVQSARPTPPKMGDLPSVRLSTTRRAFVNCGVDYFGPMEVTIGRRREKRWGVLFTCLATRAVHLELAASLSADSAILALRRLIARRGRPAVVLSDCGTNFVGASNELRAALRGLDSGQLRDEALAKGIEWRFNPPAAPHMGGCWERLVRSVKSALRVTLKERAPPEEVLHTVLLEAELIVNSRPLAYVALHPDQPTVLTPNHLLLGTATGDSCVVPYDPKDVDARRLWKKANALADIFWRRWSKEYLPTLQRRQKWLTATSPPKVGDVVLISDASQPRNMWPRGKIVKVLEGSAGAVRVVDIRTSTGTLRRPVTRIVVLPTDGSFIG